MLNLDEKVDEEVSVERIEVFSLADVVYTVPAQPGTTFALRYLRFVREHGEDAAVDYLLETMLGKAGYDALANHDQLTNTQLMTVFQVCLDIVLGAMEGPKEL